MILGLLRRSLDGARDRGLFTGEDGGRVRCPHTEEKRVACFSRVEQRRIERAAFADKRPKMFGVVLCLYTGLRVGGLLALIWADIDMRRGTVTVNKTCYDGRDENGHLCRRVDTPKTASSGRVIPLPRQLLPYLRTRKRTAAAPYVISEKGRPLVVRSYQRSFELFLRRIGLPHRGIHALRHTFATRALECGMDARTLANLLGHKNPTMTLTRYAHSLLEHKREMMDRVGRIL